MAYRKELEDLINDNGGEYRGNLTKDVTHLIAKVPSGTKYTYAGEWGIKIVSVEWLTQSLERGMTLEETLFNLLLPTSKRGQNAWIRKLASTSPTVKRARDNDVGRIQSRKLRRTASDKLNSQTAGLWTDIVNRRAELEDSKGNEWDDLPVEIRSKDGVVETEMPENHKVEKPISTPRYPSPNNVTPAKDVDLVGSWQRKELFRGKRFLVQGFDERKVCSNRISALLNLTYISSAGSVKLCRSIYVLIMLRSCKILPSSVRRVVNRVWNQGTFWYLVIWPPAKSLRFLNR